jgi:hypothetical protein
MKKQNKLSIKVRDLESLKDVTGGRHRHHRDHRLQAQPRPSVDTDPSGAGLWDYPRWTAFSLFSETSFERFCIRSLERHCCLPRAALCLELGRVSGGTTGAHSPNCAVVAEDE